jgi:Glycosyl transferase family 2
MGMSFTVIVPTCGRGWLPRTLRSIRDQEWRAGDEVLLVTDGRHELAQEQFRRSGLPGRCLETPISRNHGASQRNRGIDRAKGDYLLFLDDDDCFTPGAFAIIRAALAGAPGQPHLFRMCFARDGKILWTDNQLRPGNVGTPMIVFPNCRKRLARWRRSNVHDYCFVVDSLALWPPDALVWRQEIIAIIRPHEATAPQEPGSSSGRARFVDHCPYRHSVRGRGKMETARCRLLQELSGIRNSRWSRVGRDACLACCANALPSVEELNPVVGSLLLDIARRVQGQGGVAGCNTSKAQDLEAWAAENLDTASASDTALPRRLTEPCCHLGPAVQPQEGVSDRDVRQGAVFVCLHPNHGETTPEQCSRCRDWSERPGPAPMPLRQMLPLPARRHQPHIREWAVGVTTAPRARLTLGWCLDSLARAGWEDARLFVDGDVEVPRRHARLPVTRHETRLGAWPSYYLALVELLMRQPQADAYLMVQDDVVFYDREDLRGYLEQALWGVVPGSRRLPGAVSLFSPTGCRRSAPGWHAETPPWTWGAQVFIFPPESLKRLAADPIVLAHRFQPGNAGLVDIPGVIGEWAHRCRLPIYCPSPSLAQHIGETSTIWPGARIAGWRRADWFGAEGSSSV